MKEKAILWSTLFRMFLAQAYIVQKTSRIQSKWMVWAESVSGSNGYLVFLCGDAPMIQIDTGPAMGKALRW